MHSFDFCSTFVCKICYNMLLNSFGLSDLHGDGRVHKFSGPGLPSGFGFELTFRLKKSSEETAPPTWPANLMQSLAKYVFKSGKFSLFFHTALCNNLIPSTRFQLV